MFTGFYPQSTYAWAFLSIETTIVESLKRQNYILVSTPTNSLKKKHLTQNE